MKAVKVFSCLVLTCLFTSVNAQLRVLSDGRVQAGTLTDVDGFDYEQVATMHILGKYGDARAGSKISFGDIGRFERQSLNVFLGEYGTTDSDQLWLHGKLGFFLTTTGYANKVIAYYNPSANSNFVFNTNLVVNGVNITSDARLKDNIQSIENPLEILTQIDGVSYSYRLSEIQEARESDDAVFPKKDDCIIPIRTYVGLKQMKFVFQKYGSISEPEPKDVLETCTRDMSQELIPLRFGAYYTASGLKIVIHPDNRYELSISETRFVFPGNGMKPYEKEFIIGYSRGKWFREHNILYFQDLDMECVFSADIKSFAIDNITMPLAENWRFDLKRED